MSRPDFLNKKESKARRKIRERRLGIPPAPPTPKKESFSTCLRKYEKREKEAEKFYEKKHEKWIKACWEEYKRVYQHRRDIQDCLDQTFALWGHYDNNVLEPIYGLFKTLIKERIKDVRKRIIIAMLVESYLDSQKKYPSLGSFKTSQEYFNSIIHFEYLEYTLLSREIHEMIEHTLKNYLRKLESMLESIDNFLTGK